MGNVAWWREDVKSVGHAYPFMARARMVVTRGKAAASVGLL
jgi:hypothetical protein